MSDLHYLPDLRPGAEYPVPVSGRWTDLPVEALLSYAGALNVPAAATRAERLKSVPSPWARALMFEHALFDQNHPAHREITGEWRGLLGLLALSECLGAQIKAQSIPLQGNDVLESLARMVPPGELERWSPTVLLLINGEPIGATSPRTLAFTSLRKLKLHGIPFQREGRLIDPAAHYQDADPKLVADLRGWVDHVVARLRGEAAVVRLAGTDGAAKLIRALEDWSTSMQTGASAEYQLADQSPIVAAFPAQHDAGRVFSMLLPLKPGQATGRGDLVLARQDESLPEVVVLPNFSGDYRIELSGQPVNDFLRMPHGGGGPIRDGKLLAQLNRSVLGPNIIDVSSLFAGTLIEVQGAQAQGFTLNVRGRHILLPFKPEITKLLAPDELMRAVTLSGDSDLASGVQVEVRLPVQRGWQVVFRKKYGEHDVNPRMVTGDLAVWPDFVSKPRGEWKHYFYFHRQAAANATLRFTPLVDIVERHEDHGQQRWWGSTSEPPLAWRAHLVDNQEVEGLLLMTGLPEVPATMAPWRVSIDFGSTHTRAFRIYNTAAGQPVTEPIRIKPRTVRLFGSPEIQDEFFQVGANGAAGAEELLTSVILPSRGRARQGNSGWLPFDGLIVWDMPGALKLANDQLRTRLKWHGDSTDLLAFRSYLQQLYLMVAAEAAASGSHVESIVSAFPSVFPSILRFKHHAEWSMLRNQYGVEVRDPAPESSALMRYLSHEENVPAVTLVACDIGGSTSDFALWTNDQFRYGDSIRLAGDVIGRLMVTNQAAREAVERAAREAPLNLDFSFKNAELEWPDAADRADHKFNILLRAVARKNGGATEGLARLLGGQGAAGKLVLAHAAYLFALLSFMMGQLARRQDIASDGVEMRFGGRAAGFLSWLKPFGNHAVQEICGSFFCAGLGRQIDVSVGAAQKLKEEVGRGLLRPLAYEPPEPFERQTYFGESGFARTGGQTHSWDEVLDLKILSALHRPEQMDLSRHEQLAAFISAFQQTDAGGRVAEVLHLKPEILLIRQLREQIHMRIFGSGGLIGHGGNTGDGAPNETAASLMLEPMLVEEARTVLAFATDNLDLFDHLRQ